MHICKNRNQSDAEVQTQRQVPRTLQCNSSGETEKAVYVVLFDADSFIMSHSSSFVFISLFSLFWPISCGVEKQAFHLRVCPAVSQ